MCANQIQIYIMMVFSPAILTPKSYYLTNISQSGFKHNNCKILSEDSTRIVSKQTENNLLCDLEFWLHACSHQQVFRWNLPY